MRARGVAVLLVLGASLVGAAPVRADVEGSQGGSAFVENGDPGAESADSIAVDGPGSGGSGDDDGCEWRVLIGDDTQVPVFDADGGRLHSETGRWLAEVCEGDDLLSPIGGLGLVPEGGLVDPESLALAARDTVPIQHPAIHTSPDGARRLYTQVPTWLWVDQTWWQPYSITVTAGRVTTTVTAYPVRARWSAGDGGSVVCEGPGVEWRSGRDDEETYCKHTYRHSSSGEPDGTFTLQVTIDFDVSWSSNVGQAGTLSGVSRTAAQEVPVGEIQAIES